MIEERHWISVEGAGIALVLHHADRPQPCVVACHGLGASKDSGKYLQLSREFSTAGAAFCRFDFRGCGESEGLYAESTVEGRLSDLRAVIKFIERHRAVAPGVSLLGSSLGGFIALHYAALDASVRSVVTWNTPFTLRGLKREHGEDVAALGRPFFDELARETFAEAPKGISRSLTIHGDADETVPFEHSRLLWEQATDPKRLHVLHGADHRLTNESHRQEACRESVSWIRRYHFEGFHER